MATAPDARSRSRPRPQARSRRGLRSTPGFAVAVLGLALVVAGGCAQSVDVPDGQPAETTGSPASGSEPARDADTTAPTPAPGEDVVAGDDPTATEQPSATGPPADGGTPTEPSSATEELALPVPGPSWRGPDGASGPPGAGIELFTGAEHCEWQAATFLHVPWPLGEDDLEPGDVRQYAWDPEHVLEEYGIRRDREVDAVPDDVAATGWRTAHQELWLGDDADEFAYLVAEDGTVRRLERPVVEPGGTLGCE